MDYLSAATRLPGRCPSLGERLGLRPACCSACAPGLPRTPSVHSARMLSGLRRGFCRPRISGVLSKCVPRRGVGSPSEGHRPGCERRPPPHHFSTTPSFGPTGQPFSCGRGVFSGRRRPANTPSRRSGGSQGGPDKTPGRSARIVRSVLHGNRLAAKLTTEPRGSYLAQPAGPRISTAVGRPDKSKFARYNKTRHDRERSRADHWVAADQKRLQPVGAWCPRRRMGLGKLWRTDIDSGVREVLLRISLTSTEVNSV